MFTESAVNLMVFEATWAAVIQTAVRLRFNLMTTFVPSVPRPPGPSMGVPSGGPLLSRL